jgi:hypothetical protein
MLLIVDILFLLLFYKVAFMRTFVTHKKQNNYPQWR